MANSTQTPDWLAVYNSLFNRWGPQDWWPGDTPFEIIVGAILTQNTAWRNVEKAIQALREEKLLNPEVFETIPANRLAELIRPAGYYNIKSQRLKNFGAYLKKHHNSSLKCMFSLPTEKLRHELLAVHGIGPETADSILLYAGERPVFVVDAYTRRFMQRHNWIEGSEKYDRVATIFMEALPPDAQLYNEFHALIVKLGKEHCRTKAKCEKCPLNIYPIVSEYSPAS